MTTTFIEFAQAHGILINEIPPIGIWKRYHTEDHPKSWNGVVNYNETFGTVINWGTMSEHAVWRGQEAGVIDQAARRQFVANAKKEQEALRIAGAAKAEWIISQCKMEPHEYLASKGFPSESGLVWANKGAKLLVIPMRINKKITSAQIINFEGGKKFLSGGTTKLATHVIDNRGVNLVCEGYATALSVRRALTAFKMAYTIHVCFSASNALAVSQTLKRGVFIADNDKPDRTGRRAGQSVAEASGWPVWIAPDEGVDANDFEREYGYFRLGAQIKALVMSLRG